MRQYSISLWIFMFSVFSLVQCKNNRKPPEKDIVTNPAKLSERTAEDIRNTLAYMKENKGKLNDSVSFSYPVLVDSFYEANQYHPLWFREDQTRPAGDSLLNFIRNGRFLGLFPNDYHAHMLSFIQRVFQVDSNARKNAALWARADLLMTDAFFRLVKDLKQGRIPYDSVTLRTDSVLPDQLYTNALNEALQQDNVNPVLHGFEPRAKGYDSLIAYIPGFLAGASFAPYTHLPYPYTDSVAFFKLFQRRLQETGNLPDSTAALDTTGFKIAIRKYQKKYGFKLTGRISDPLIDKLNNTDEEKFKRIAITLDRYKKLPDSLPETYAWVNLPSFTLEIRDHDTLVFSSRVIVGGPQTRTPVLTSEISNFITMPQWTVPYSIIFKEMLPKIRQNVDFLDKENLMVVDKNDSVLDPHLIKWSRLNKNHFPYQIKQKQGDDNSLGVIKFNFRNKYSVYLHDTNVRWMFGKSYRALSHGCVRVKEWKKFADFLVRKDTLKYPSDTLKAWVNRQEKHVVSGFQRLPLFIRYFTCEGKGGQIRFYEDIYDEDRYLSQKYFANKSVE
ncbi:MAG: L,D-transpeptidase family protein [Bacteroidota bacterium]|nr:L,D-transpeptidase family protein [Bacteroidota bacterium]MDP4250463.1 L,D-transpeptidase family protein [Bacteroidota bacterium]